MEDEFDKKSKIANSEIQSKLNSFFPSLAQNSIDKFYENEKSLSRTITNKNLRKSFQTTLFHQDVKAIKISKNIDRYLEFWNEYFPNVIDSHLSIDEMGILGITDGQSFLEEEKSNFEFSIELSAFLHLLKIIRKIGKNFDLGDVDFLIVNKKLLEVRLSGCDIRILLDLKKISKIENNNTIKPIKTDNFYKISSNMQKIGTRNYLLSDFSEMIKCYIVSKDVENIKINQNRLGEVHNYYAIGQLQSLVDILIKFKSAFNEEIEDLFVHINTSNLKILPKIAGKRRKIGLFLAKKVEIND